MRDGGRIAAAIEILKALEARPRPVTLALKDWGKESRFAGAKDRAFVSGLVLDTLRKRRSAAWRLADESARAAVLGVLRFSWDWTIGRIAEAAADPDHGPGALSDSEVERLAAPQDLLSAPLPVRGDYPDWLDKSFARVFGEERAAQMELLAERAPVDLRTNTLKSDTGKVLAALETLEAHTAGLTPQTVRIAAPQPAERAAPVEAHPAFQKGWFEVQDAGSQAAAAVAGEVKGQQVLDFCAGGGGKTLALAAMMANTGMIYAFDTDPRRMMDIIPRATRAGVENLDVRSPMDKDPLKGLAGTMDLVFVDAPCTGSGTWRRHPDAKWRLTPKLLERRCEEQASVMEDASRFVKAGGRMAYVTCSVLAEENEDQVAAFLARNPTWSVRPIDRFPEHATSEGYVRLSPLSAGTDGFFAAVLERARIRVRRRAMSQDHERLLIVDFGSQVTQLIARRVRESGVYCEVVPYDKAAAHMAAHPPKAVILSGGPESAHEEGSPRAPDAVFSSGIPVLGICYGEMTICQQLGGRVESGHHREFGRAEIDIQKDCPLFAGLDARETVWMSHGDKIVAVPDGFEVVATSANSPFAAIANEDRRIYGVQFHAEVAHTPNGATMLRNFTHHIAGFKGDWTMANFRKEMVHKIRMQVGEGRVICGLSGGVDSSVAAVLIHEAIGVQLTCVFVDTGLLRLNEADQVVTLFRNHYNIPLIHVDAAKEFLGELKGVSDPETKRKTIGRVFIETFDREANKIEGAEFLAQGTLYPDVIESIGGKSHVIKSHHNVGGLPERMKLKLVEPLRDLFKDEVRALGVELGLPPAFVGRHPFPGPGLGIRIPGEVTPEKVSTLQKADAIYLEEIRAAGLYDQIWQAFAVLLPVRTVGVMGDGRTYDEVCALRAVTSTDGMTADFYEFPWAVLGKAATRIINEVRGINRVVYDVTSKPPGTIEWE